MDYLRSKKLDQLIVSLKQPVLGICLGMQLMCKYSEENNTECLGIFDETVKCFIPQGDMKVPHMGWNNLTLTTDGLILLLKPNLHISSTAIMFPLISLLQLSTEYIIPFSAAMHQDNFYAVQFHPEKSAETGELVLKSFLKL